MTDAFNWHGGRIDAARSRFSVRGDDWIDLSTGINPVPWPHVKDVPWDWSALPSLMALAELERVAAGYFGVDSANICALPGSEVGLRFLPAVLKVPGRHVAPTYRTHGAIFPQGVSDEIIGGKPSALLLANPNNPDGQVRTAEEVRDLLRQQQEANTWLIVDEAFADVLPTISLAAEIDDEKRLILFRSFGKFFGLAGIRLGFVLGPARVIHEYRQLLGDWPVHSAGIAIATAAYGDSCWIAQAREGLNAASARLTELLRKHGFDPIGDCPLFTLIETEAAPHLFERLAHQAILTRPFDYAPHWLRIGLPGDEPAWQRLDRGLSDG